MALRVTPQPVKKGWGPGSNPNIAHSLAIWNLSKDFPGGPAIKNLPANAGDTDSIPGPGSSHVQQQGDRVREPQLLKPSCPRACAPQRKPPQ